MVYIKQGLFSVGHRYEVNEMDLWIVVKERYMFLSIFIIIILASLILIFATWKNRSNIPRSLIGLIIVICTLILGFSLVALMFTISFGYNS